MWEKGQANRSRRPLLLGGVLALALLVVAGPIGGVATAAKKKKSKGGGTVDITKVVGAPIPDATVTTNGLLTSTIDVGGKQFRGTRIRDVNLTLTTTGSMPDSADDLTARLTAPDGTTVWLLNQTLVGQSVGPLTLDDESVNRLGGPPPAPNSFTLVSPYAGTAQIFCWITRGPCAFSVMDNHPVTGTWTLRIYDVETIGSTSVLSSWRLNVLAGKPFKTK
jgi:subtilisin-like proprotein convertase family protein